MNRSRPSSRRERRGTLFLEALIVIALACLFLVLLIPQFQRARAAARRTQCLNNLRNVTLALMNYSDLHGVFPPGYVARNVEADDPATSESGSGWAWGAMFLPQLEQQPLFRTLDFEAPCTPGSPTLLNTMLCPDDPAAIFTVTSDQAGLVSLDPPVLWAWPDWAA